MLFRLKGVKGSSQRGLPLPKKLSEMMKQALELLAEIADDPKIKKPEAKAVFSFSRTVEGVKGMEAL